MTRRREHATTWLRPGLGPESCRVIASPRCRADSVVSRFRYHPVGSSERVRRSRQDSKTPSGGVFSPHGARWRFGVLRSWREPDLTEKAPGPLHWMTRSCAGDQNTARALRPPLAPLAVTYEVRSTGVCACLRRPPRGAASDAWHPRRQKTRPQTGGDQSGTPP